MNEALNLAPAGARRIGGLRVARAYRLVFAALTVAAIVYQLVSLLGKPTFDPVSFFSYFTIDSNIIAAGVLLAAAARPLSPRIDFVRGAAVVYMTVTGVVFTLLLSGTDVDTAVPWVNTVVHEVMPLVMLGGWLLIPAVPMTRLSAAVAWLAFPIVWMGYTLIRGAISQRYPYPFINPLHVGYASVAVYCGVIAVFMVLVSLAVAWLSRWRQAMP